MSKKIITLFVLAVCVVILLLVLLQLKRNQTTAQLTNQTETATMQSTESPNFEGSEDAFKNALNLYIQKKQEGIDMTNGPCLGKIADDWVLDISHNPRQAVDEKKENQCIDYVEGRASHFIELDPNGNLIRSQ